MGAGGMGGYIGGRLARAGRDVAFIDRGLVWATPETKELYRQTIVEAVAQGGRNSDMIGSPELVRAG
jgi:hypothetical protein